MSETIEKRLSDLGVTLPFMTGLLHYDFPFNVRELEAVIKRGIALSESSCLDTAHLPDEMKELMKSYGTRGARPSSTATGPNSFVPRSSSPSVV